MFLLCFPKWNKWIFPFPPFRAGVNEMEKLVLNQVGKEELRVSPIYFSYLSMSHVIIKPKKTPQVLKYFSIV
jgi:hypothetical protein